MCAAADPSDAGPRARASGGKLACTSLATASSTSVKGSFDPVVATPSSKRGSACIELSVEAIGTTLTLGHGCVARQAGDSGLTKGRQERGHVEAIRRSVKKLLRVG